MLNLKQKERNVKNTMTYFEMVKKDIENAILDGYYNEAIYYNKKKQKR